MYASQLQISRRETTMPTASTTAAVRQAVTAAWSSHDADTGRTPSRSQPPITLMLKVELPPL